MNTFPVRKYAMSDLVLSRTAKRIIRNLERDSVYFQDFNISNDAIIHLKALQSQFEDIIDDILINGQKSNVTSDREIIRKQLLIVIKNIRLRIKSYFGDKHEVYKECKFTIIARATLAELPLLAENIAVTTAKHLVPLAAYGLTQAELDAFMELVGHYKAEIQRANAARTNRTELARERITLGNQLYDLLSIYTHIARTRLATVSPVRVQGYILYPNRKKRRAAEPET